MSTDLLRGSVSALGSRTGTRRVLVAYATFGLLEFYVWLIVVLWAYDVGGTSLAGFAAVAQLLPASLGAPILAGFSERFPTGARLVMAYLLVTSGAAATWIALALSAPVPIVLLCSTWLTTAISGARPVHFAVLPDLTRAAPEQLVSATSLSSVLDGSVRFLGPVIAGITVASVGLAPSMAFGAMLGLLAALLCLGLQVPRPTTPAPLDRPTAIPTGIASGFLIRLDRSTLVLLAVMGLDFVLTGTVDILGVAYAEEVLGDGDSAAGVVVGAMGVGALVGAAVSGVLAQRRNLTRVIVAGTVMQGVVFAGMVAADGLLAAVLLLAAAGVGGAVTMVAGRTLLQRTTDSQVLGRVFAMQESVSLLGLAIGAMLAPVLVNAVGVKAAWAPLGVAVTVMGLLSMTAVRALNRDARWLPVELALLRGVPALAALPPYGLERLAGEAQWRQFRPGEVVVTADADPPILSIVAEGEASAWVAGIRRAGTVGPGSWIGDEALGEAAPRPVTVVAETSGRLLQVRQAALLRAAGDELVGEQQATPAADNRAVPG